MWCCPRKILIFFLSYSVRAYEGILSTVVGDTKKGGVVLLRELCIEYVRGNHLSYPVPGYLGGDRGITVKPGLLWAVVLGFVSLLVVRPPAQRSSWWVCNGGNKSREMGRLSPVI